MQALMSIQLFQYYVEHESIPTEIIQDEDKDIFYFKYLFPELKKNMLK